MPSLQTSLLVLGFSLSIASPAVAQAPKKKSKNEQAESVKTRKDLLEQTIMTLNKNKKCQVDGECEALEMGSRICGGPSQYLIVSLSNPQFSSVKAKVTEYTAVEKELNLVDPPNDCPPAPNQPDPKCSKEKEECYNGPRR